MMVQIRGLFTNFLVPLMTRINIYSKLGAQVSANLASSKSSEQVAKLLLDTGYNSLKKKFYHKVYD